MTIKHERRSGRERRRFNQFSTPSLGQERRLHGDQRKRLLVEYQLDATEEGTAGLCLATFVDFQPNRK